jgi:hypothetical protein
MDDDSKPTGGGGQADYGSAGPQDVQDEGDTDSSSPAGASGGPDAGSPGGMGGVRGGMPNPDNRPNGGVSPLGNSSGDNDRH